MNGSESESPRPATRWEVISVGHGGWRICDGSLSETDGSRLVAYVDRNVTGSLEVLWLRNPRPARSRYRKLADLLADLDALIAEPTPARPRSARPNEIPHFPPRG